MRGDEGHQPQPHRVGQRLDQRRDLLGLFRGQRLRGQRRVARHGSARVSSVQRIRHASRSTGARCHVPSSAPARHRQTINVPLPGGCDVPRPARPQRRRSRRSRSRSTRSCSAPGPPRHDRVRQLRRRGPAAQAGPDRVPRPGGTLNHLGVEVDATEAVDAASPAGGRRARVDRGAHHCCYALQDKVWVDGPDGEPWEIYTVLADSPTFAAGTAASAAAAEAPLRRPASAAAALTRRPRTCCCC